jgi:hypothetical protein
MDEWVNEAELIDAIDPVLKALSVSVGASVVAAER